MPKIPRLLGREIVAAFEKAGYYVDRVRGSHHIMKHDERLYRLSVPVHAGKTVGIGLLKQLIEKADMTVEMFVDLL